MDPAKSRTIQKILIPLFLATLLSLNRLLNIRSVQEAVNVIVRVIALTSFIFIVIKMAPQIFNNLVNK